MWEVKVLNLMTERINKRILIPLAATLICMVVIFLLSAQPATVSAGNSRDLVSKVVNATVKVIGEDLTQQQIMELVDRINAVAREFMHAVVYFVLGIFTQLTMLGVVRGKLLSGFATFIFCVTYGITDEIHQLFVPGRAFQFSDLVMDAAGATVAITLVLLVHIVRYRRKTL